MKPRNAIRAATQASTIKPTAKTDWLTYIIRVLAFIGLWQVIANGSQLLAHWF